MKESVGQPPPKKVYKAFWIGQCRWASRLLVKDSAGQAPPKKITRRSGKDNAAGQIGYW